MTGTAFGRYRVMDRIADGGFATVYLAEDPSLTGRVAVKVLKEGLAADGDIRSRFISEARVMRRLATKSLVTVHDIDEQDGQPYFVMEYCERGTLADRLAESSRTATLDEALQLARFLAEALMPVHGAGIAHRDLKPANLLIRRTDVSTRTVVGELLAPDEELVLGDFGLAKVIEPLATRFTLAMGTPGYGAPEQFEGVGSVDATADVYAASATLVAAMSGSRPQATSTPDTIVFSPDDLAATGPLEAELTRGLAHDRDDRQQTIAEWYQALAAAADSPDAAAGPPIDGVVDLGIEHLSDYRMVGRGGFSVVYAASHALFQRPVAVKVLSRQLEESDRRRFERECQLMGQMSDHPNVVTVHTAGYTDDNSPYILMELVEGGTLADLVRARGRIPWSEAVAHIGPIALALGHGHGDGILHRDVKPENILLDAGVPKLADFGIASFRDAAGATSTHVTASWLHTAPETFENSRDERSDLYSLASTLYQLVAGHAPFWRADDESLSPLMKRLITDPPPPVSADLVPPGVNEFFSSALAKDPALRPQTTAAFIDAMHNLDTTTIVQEPAVDPSNRTTILAEPPPTAIRRPPPEPLVVPSGHAGDGKRTAAALLVGLLIVGFLGAAALTLLGNRGDGGDTAIDPLDEASTDLEESEQDEGTGEDDDGTADADEGTTETEPDDTPQLARVPAVVDLSLAAAEVELRLAGLVVQRRLEESSSVEPDTVVGQEPNAGEEVDAGSTVVLLVSRGPVTVQVPSLQDRTEADALAALSGAGLAGAVAPEASDSVPAGRVVRSDPSSGQTVNEGTVVRLVVSSGPDIVEASLPDVAGLTVARAFERLGDAGFTNVTSNERNSSDVPKGSVIGTERSPGQRLPIDTAITLVVSDGPVLVEIESVKGLTVDAATAAVRAAPYLFVPTVRTVERPSGDPAIGTVVDTEPGAGTLVEPGSGIVLIEAVPERRQECPTRSVPVPVNDLRTWTSRTRSGSDRNFGSNRSLVNAWVESSWGPDDVRFRLHMSAEGMDGENTAGWGESPWEVVYRAEPNDRILAVSAGTLDVPRSDTAERMEPSIDQDHHDPKTVTGERLVRSWRVVSDTDGDDVGRDNGDLDANVTAMFATIDVLVETQEGDCIPA